MNDVITGAVAAEPSHPQDLRSLLHMLSLRQYVRVVSVVLLAPAKLEAVLHEYRVPEEIIALVLAEQALLRGEPALALVDSDSGETVSVSRALAAARKARTPKAFNEALRMLMISAGKTQGDVLRHDKAHGNELSKSTISRMVSSDKLCSRHEQIRAFVRACEAGNEAAMWVKSWRDLRSGKPTTPARSTSARPLSTGDKAVLLTGVTLLASAVLAAKGDRLTLAWLFNAGTFALAVRPRWFSGLVDEWTAPHPATAKQTGPANVHRLPQRTA
ncbi:hypothetical protein [Actinokineospora sp. NPDC004072]